jgi:ParB family transcriptional regulator, chromosome partitioning protein
MPDEVTAPEPGSPTASRPVSSVEGVAHVSLDTAEPERRVGVTLPSTRKVAGPLAVVAAERILDDEQFQLLPIGDVDPLAKSLARLGQLFPVDLRLRRPNRYQIVTGFRRVAAARLLQRPRILARVHPDLSDEDALLMALADLCRRAHSDVEALRTARDRLSTEGRLFPLASEMLEQAISDAQQTSPHPDPLSNPHPEPLPEGEGENEEEVELGALCEEVMRRLAGLNQDLSSIAEMWADVEPLQRRALLEQLRYPGELADYLESID